MNTATPCVLRVERVDDIPVLFASLQRLQVAEFLDRHFPTHHLWKGELSFGEVVCVWLVLLTCQGDHRLYHLLPWVEEHLLTLQACLGKSLRPLDFHDDRLADVLDALAQPTPWQAFEADLNGPTVRVYALAPSLFRIDTTTASSYAEVLSEHGLLQFGHSKDRDDLPQLKIAAAALDPLGLPVSTLAVAGNSADDPWYIPEIPKVQRSFGAGGKTYVGDCKRAAWATRAYVASTQDYDLCPLSEKQLSHEERRALLQPVWTSQQPLQPVYRPQAMPEQPPELVAEGFSVEVVVQAEVNGRLLQWTERRGWCGRSPSPPARSRGGTNACNRPRSHGSSSTHASRARNAWVRRSCTRPPRRSSSSRAGKACGRLGWRQPPGSGVSVATATARSKPCRSKTLKWKWRGGKEPSSKPNARWAGRSTRPTTGR